MMKLFNTLSGKKETLQRPRTGPLHMFVCGPTVYDHAHIGHGRTYLVFDAFARYLRSRGFPLFYLQNITDIDDKIISRGRNRGIDPQKLAAEFERSYRSDMKKLGIISVNQYGRASAFIPEIVRQTQTLIRKGYAYEIPGSGWYFNIARFKEYGKLSRRTVLQAEDAISRVDEASAKRNKGDFALWKYVSVPERLRVKRNLSRILINSEPAWRTPLGWGRPGWHIEDTAITEHFFGPQYDLHGGADELKFPHHEAEIAQQEAASGRKPFVKIWMHTGLLLIGGAKMGKSLGNFITIRDFLAEHPPFLLRWLILLHHYRSPINYTAETLEQAKDSLASLAALLAKLSFVEKHAAQAAGKTLSLNQKKYERAFHAALEDDFNTPKAVAATFSFAETVQKNLWKISRSEAETAHKLITLFLGSLGLVIPAPSPLPQTVKRLLRHRELYRGNKQFMQADALRKKLHTLGYEVEDTPLGPFAYKNTKFQITNSK